MTNSRPSSTSSRTRTCPGSPSKSPRPGDTATCPRMPSSTRPSRRRGCFRPGSTSSRTSWAQAYIVDKSNLSTERAAYGLKVRVLDLDLNEEEDFILVGPGEEDYDQNKILDHQPDRPGSRGQEARRRSPGRNPSRHPQPQDRRDQPEPLRSRPENRRGGASVTHHPPFADRGSKWHCHSAGTGATRTMGA